MGINLISGKRWDFGSLADFNVTSLTTQRYKSPLTWVGSQDENVLGLLSELMQLVIDLCGILDSHTHPSVAPITEGPQVAQVGTDTTAVKARLDGIKE